MDGDKYSVKKDYSKAKDFFEKACEAKSGDGCYALGEMYAKGIGVEKDFVKSQYLFDLACQRGSRKGCSKM